MQHIVNCCVLFSLSQHSFICTQPVASSQVGMAALEFAKDKIMMGAQRKSAIISPETMKITA